MGEIGLTGVWRPCFQTYTGGIHPILSVLLKKPTYEMAKLFYSVPEEEQIDCIHEILQGVWTRGKDLSFKTHFQRMQKRLEIDNITEQDVEALLKQNDELCQQKHQPDFPVLELRIDGQSYVFLIVCIEFG